MQCVNTVPPEIWDKIFCYCIGKELRSLWLVCHHFRNIILNSKHLKLTAYEFTEYAEYNIAHIISLRKSEDKKIALTRIALLLHYPINVTHNDKSSLEYAIQFEHIDLIKFLLANGAEINFGLHIAINVYNMEIVKILLDYGADPNIKDKHGWNALHHAAFCTNTEKFVYGPSGKGGKYDYLLNLKLLLERPEMDINALTNDGKTILDLVCYYSYGEIVGMPLTYGADHTIGDGSAIEYFKKIRSSIEEHKKKYQEMMLGIEDSILINKRSESDGWVNKRR